MVQFVCDPKNQPQFENTELDVDVDNGKWRAPASRMSTEGGLHSNASSPGMMKMGGLISDFEAVLSAQAHTSARRVHSARRDVLRAAVRRRCEGPAARQEAGRRRFRYGVDTTR